MNESLHATALIAGGRSSRMGSDKAFLEWQGRPLWQAQLEKLNATRPRQVFLSSRPDQPFPPVPGVARVPDQWPDSGPLGGVASCLACCESPLLLVLAIDLPLISIELLTELLAAATPDCGVIPWSPSADRFEPLAAIYPVLLFPRAAEQLRTGRLALQAFIRLGIASGHLRPHPVTDSAPFANLNSPSDLDGARDSASGVRTGRSGTAGNTGGT